MEFHGNRRSPGEQNQAAGYVYEYRKALASKTIDAFILHPHVDHAKVGLCLGFTAMRQVPSLRRWQKRDRAGFS